jgi:ferredoxin
VTQVPTEAMVLALARGAVRVLLLGRWTERAGPEAQAALANDLAAGLGLGDDRAVLLDLGDPDTLAERLYDLPGRDGVAPAAFAPVGGKRTVLRLALAHLRARSAAKPDAIALPDGAPYGAVTVAVDGCTLCLSCVSACPTRALRDAADKPSLSFVEDACIQCGLCRVTCPEKVVSLTPRYSFADSARTPVPLKEEDPFNCVRCGKPFGTKSSIEKIAARLASHPMFTGAALERIRMCDDCRVIDQFQEAQPMAYGTPRVTRTTDDDLRERAEGKASE